MKIEIITEDEYLKVKRNSWNERDNSLVKIFKFENYMDGIYFVNEVAKLAREANHHPTMTVDYDSVVVELTTHDTGGISDMDRHMAKAIDNIRL